MPIKFRGKGGPEILVGIMVAAIILIFFGAIATAVIVMFVQLRGNPVIP